MKAPTTTARVLLATAILSGCNNPKPSRPAENLARPLSTGYENNLSAPLGRGGEIVAVTATGWDSGWKSLGLPGTPPRVDFTHEVAALRADYFGGSSSDYESGVDSAQRNPTGDTILVFAHVRAHGAGVDTSSRKILAAALHVAPSTRVAVRWHLTN